jgi:hypothetical protein
MINKLELPNLIVVNKWQERTEHFGRIDYKTYGEIELENTSHWLNFESNLDDMMDFILDVQETRFTIHDESLKFSAMIKPEIISLKYEKGVLSINYKWKEV